MKTIAELRDWWVSLMPNGICDECGKNHNEEPLILCICCYKQSEYFKQSTGSEIAELATNIYKSLQEGGE